MNQLKLIIILALSILFYGTKSFSQTTTTKHMMPQAT